MSGRAAPSAPGTGQTAAGDGPVGTVSRITESKAVTTVMPPLCRAPRPRGDGTGNLWTRQALGITSPPNRVRRLGQAFRSPPKPESSGKSSSLRLSSSMFTSLNVSTRTCLTKRAGRYMSQTQASAMETSKNTSP